jgi:hypothetical protein
MSLEKTKTRDLSSHVHYPKVDRFDPSTGKLVKSEIAKPSSQTWKGRQETVSSGHRKGRNGKYDSGGPFFTHRKDPGIKTRIVQAHGIDIGGEARYFGPIHIPVPLAGPIGGVATSNQDSSYLDTYGATAIHIVDPTNPNAQFGIALGETLLDKRLSVPGIQGWRRRTEVAKAAGSEYLSAVFGWLPLVRDMKNTAQSIKDGNTIMENYRSASGTLVHREFAFDDIVDSSEVIVNPSARCTYSAVTNVVPLNGTAAPITLKTESHTKRWFSGAFTYTSGGNSDLQRCTSINSEADKLFGLSLTPDIVWELTPWSWAIDWVSNAGDVISNATSFALAGLVMKYGYIMEETSTTWTYSMPSTGINGVKGSPPDCVFTKVTKRRREANPFGFGLTWEGLSPTQLAITAALGITHLR